MIVECDLSQSVSKANLFLKLKQSLFFTKPTLGENDGARHHKQATYIRLIRNRDDRQY